MSLLNIRRVNKIYSKVFYSNKNSWRENVLIIIYTGDDDNINENKKYKIKYNGKELVYKKLDDFYKDYNIYPKKDINPLIINVVDNSHLEKYLYLANEEG